VLSLRELRQHQRLQLTGGAKRVGEEMASWVEDVWRFHEAVGGHTGERFSRAVLRWRRRFIEEEAREAIEALAEAEDEATRGEVAPETQRHLVSELIDLTYVVMGTFVALGIDPEPAWRAVHEANIRKQPASTAGGKAVKPPGWEPPKVPLVELRMKARR
jgi:predicted HAD superfamily Cof-like phosphohydrolase